MKKDILEYNGFTGSVHFSTQDEIFYGRIEGVPGLVCFEGSTLSELKQAFEGAVKHYVEVCAELNKPVVKTLRGSFNVRINPDLHRKAYNASLSKGISLNQFVQKAIEDQLAN